MYMKIMLIDIDSGDNGSVAVWKRYKSMFLLAKKD